MAAQVVDVCIFAYPSHVDELRECLFRDSVNVHALLRDEACQFLELFGRTFGIGAVQRLGAARLADGDLGRCMTDGTLSRHAECAYTLGDLNHLGDNLVSLDDTDFCSGTSQSQTLALADVAQRSTSDCGALQFYGLEDGYG